MGEAIVWTPSAWKMSQYSGKICFFEGKCFTGRKLEIRGDCDNFQDRGFMNRVNSIRVESGAFVCFDHPDFKGQQYILEHGEYPEFQRWNAHNDHMGSCRPIRMHGEHYRMEIFDAPQFAGQCVELCDDCPFLQGRGSPRTASTPSESTETEPGCCTKSLTSVAACTLWREETTAPTWSGRQRTPASSPSAG